MKEHEMIKISNVVRELHHRAWQSRAAARIDRTSKTRTAEAEKAARELENLANDMEYGRWPRLTGEASDQFFDRNVRSEMVKLEAGAVLKEMAEAIGDGSSADLLAALAKERDAARAAVRTNLAALEQAARETEQLERMLQDRDDEGAE